MAAAGYQSLICDDEARRAQVQKHATLNGIDYIEVVTEPLADNQRVLKVYFIPKTTDEGQDVPSDLLNALHGKTNLVEIRGGVRVQHIEVTEVSARADHLEVRVAEPGDFSTYELSVANRLDLDPAYSRCDFSFKAGCPSRFDCKPDPVCPPEPRVEPLIDYMAKDYASFRQALIDLIPTLVPDWQERHEADLGMALIELLAYVGDQLSYYQDAVANEAYLETARQRISVRRHARLIDYRMHDGASASAFIHLGLKTETSGTLPRQTQILSRVEAHLGSRIPPHGPVIHAELKHKALAAADVVFETLEVGHLHARLNRISIHPWGNRQCCLPRGTTTVDLVDDLAFSKKDVAPPGPWRLKPGDFLLFEEVVSPETGLSADADASHRQVVRLKTVEPTRDPLLGLDLTRITWDRTDALRFPLCVSARLADRSYVADVSVARGNLVLADHGQTLTEWHPGTTFTEWESGNPVYRTPGIQTGGSAYRFRLREGPLSFRTEPKKNGSLPSARDLSITDSQPAAQVRLDVYTKANAPVEPASMPDLPDWTPLPDLLDGDPFTRAFVVETDNDGRAVIRFGDDEFGMSPPDGSHIHVTYRVGVGTGGNVGSDSLTHVVDPGTADDWPDIVGVRNPLAAWGSKAAEPTEQVQQLAPAAFRAEQLRAVTEEDYARAAEKHPEVSKAVATFRWTGSWHTVFITIDPVGRTDLPSDLERSVQNWVTRYTQTGYDLEIEPPTFVPLEIEVDVCAAPDHFRSDVEEALLAAIGNRPLPGGGLGFFHPDNLTFGQPLYISRLYAAIEAVSGVDSAEITRFQRLGKVPNEELEQGYVPMGRLEVVRLDNDPSLPENGELRFNMLGGK
jgi:hypothetical protein